MKHDELIEALRRLQVETGSLACLGCGHEHNCSTQGCAILREAVAALEKAPRPKPSKTALEHIKILRGLRRTALEMANTDPDAPTSWRMYADAMATALDAMAYYYGAGTRREEDGKCG